MMLPIPALQLSTTERRTSTWSDARQFWSRQEDHLVGNLIDGIVGAREEIRFRGNDLAWYCPHVTSRFEK